MSIVFGAIMPHPPIVVPAVGKERLKEAEKSRNALEVISQRFKGLEFDTIVVITPHGDVGQASVPVYTGHVFEGNFGQFGQPKPSFNFKGDPQLGLAVVKDTHLATACPETVLDHGILVPLYYPTAAGIKKPILPIAIAFMPLSKLFEFGQALSKTIDRLGRKVLLIASADMSHRLTQDAPSGFSPRGREFDEKLVELVKNYDIKGILKFDPDLAEEAGQDALWSISILLGALDGKNLKPEILSYEGPFGVGYLVAAFQP
ncbi:AmmeMemoRadiSam system protein B [candidate division WOR-1 bacterium RIFCSPHIGHO2_01_FULL_53_15]|uniref:AmmeMemoRadiSam system protein B n=1 Tax=candidate division WOR-1 bacterium RIFCSPHIGHO2_01_FULL_53_15 TaxID=1802564 RepID=A0A1F4Q418_UNCSA|nr:MAG: AmmeMemoRadiSam system protein B [candidate division WOR-1 bacterium RIFCSPHIGHO2_01_FULL_53_15]OGC13667.1 MAG: AmmeMemoRadiSam system protein B [candidate division WOR-1 bacterium RIFCSPHIGHO2_02_FULL_53_26]